MTTLPKKAHWPPAYIYLQTAAIALAVWYYAWYFYNDDAYISLTYVRNLLAGNGLTWTPGERLEGYSNFLFILMVAALGRFGVDLVLASKIISFAAFFGIIAVMLAYMRHYRPKPRAYTDWVCEALCISLVASSLPLLTWCIGGLEGNLYTLFLTAAICLTLGILSDGKPDIRRAAVIGLCLSLAALTRPDGMIFSAFTLGFLGLLWLKPKTRAQVSLRDIMIAGLVFAAVFVPYSVWRLHYFGEWLPNTYYAKTYGIAGNIIFTFGFGYLITFLIAPPFVALFTLFLFIIAWRMKLLTLPMLYLASFAGLYCVYVTSVGGDFMPYERFMIPLIPVLSLLIYHCFIQIMPYKEKLFRDLCGVLLALSFLQFATLGTNRENSMGALSSLVVKDYITEHWPKGSLIALNPVGVLPYFVPQYRYIDMLGLLDKTIARRHIGEDMLRAGGQIWIGHLKGDGNYVLSRRPDYIIFGHAWGDDKPLFLSDLEISENPEFLKHYSEIETWITPPPELLPLLLHVEETNQEMKKKYGIQKVKGLVWNDKKQVRFVYYQRIDK